MARFFDGTILEDVSSVAGLLRAGKVVVFPTETVYALAAATDHPEAWQALSSLKQRDPEKKIAMLAPSLASVRSWVRVHPMAQRLAEVFWPGPLTLVMEADGVFGPSLGVRVPDHPVAQAILEALGGPVWATSVNRSGESPAVSVETIDPLLLAAGIEAVVDGGAATLGVASTVLDLRDPAMPRVLRQGSLAVESLEEALACKLLCA
jgi:L-threonylcarbamoyladenylate synthase